MKRFISIDHLPGADVAIVTGFVDERFFSLSSKPPIRIAAAKMLEIKQVDRACMFLEVSIERELLEIAWMRDADPLYGLPALMLPLKMKAVELPRDPAQLVNVPLKPKSIPARTLLRRFTCGVTGQLVRTLVNAWFFVSVMDLQKPR
jgi:hypothetical protein